VIERAGGNPGPNRKTEMDYKKLKALTVAETEARAQEMLASANMLEAKAVYEVAQAEWRSANERYQGAKKTRETYLDEAVKRDATEAFEKTA
jgi:hypothetical protein